MKNNYLQILNEIKPLNTLPNSELITSKQVSDYFEVNDSAIKMIYKNNKRNFDETGSFILTYEIAKNIFNQKGVTSKGKVTFEFSNTDITMPMRGVRVFTVKCVVYIGYMLHNSIIASKLRHMILGTGSPFMVFDRKENSFIEFLIPFLKQLDLDYIRQYKVMTYRLDLYIPKLNIAIEYDENNHKGYSYEKQQGREDKIKNKIGCTFIRVDDLHENFWNYIYILTKIYNINIDFDNLFYNEYKKLNKTILELTNKHELLKYKYYGQEPSDMFCDLEVVGGIK